MRVSTWFSFYFSSIRAVTPWGVAQLWSEHVPRFAPSIAKTLLAEPNLLWATDKLL